MGGCQDLGGWKEVWKVTTNEFPGGEMKVTWTWVLMMVAKV